MFRACILEQAAKWASIQEEEIRIAYHPNCMNPRITLNQLGNIIPDVIRDARNAKKKAKVKKAADNKRATVAIRKEKAIARKKARVEIKAVESTSTKRMTRCEASRHASWYKKTEERKIKIRFY